MRLSVYPEFTPLSLEHKDIFDAAFRENPPEISEFTFTNIYSWRTAYDFKVSGLNGAIILRSDSAKIPRFFQPIGSIDVIPAMERVLSDSRATFIRIPEQIVSRLRSDKRYKIIEDRDNADYLYLTSDLAALKGSKYDGKRNLIRKFKSNYAYQYEEINSVNVNDILTFEEVWCSAKDCEHTLGLANERKAIHEMVSCFGQFGLKAGVIRIESKIRAVAIGEALNPETLVVHILKADPAIPGLYQAINNEFLRIHVAGFTYINLEQDLGVAGLRTSKESYHPAQLIKKYTISL